MAELSKTVASPATVPKEDYDELHTELETYKEMLNKSNEQSNFHREDANSRRQAWMENEKLLSTAAETISALKRMCMDRDLEIAYLKGMSKGMALQEVATYERENPTVEMDRKLVIRGQGEYPIGYAETPNEFSTRKDWLNIEQSLEANKRNRY